MKISFALIAATILLLTPNAQADWVEDAVKQIRADYNATESASLTKKHIKLDDGPEVAELTKYYKDDSLVKMVFTSGGDHGTATDQYYFKNGRLYFIYQSQGYWSFNPKGPEGTTIDTGREQRIYLKGGKIVRHLVKEVSSRDPNAINKLLAKAPNKPTNDPEAAMGLSNAGYRLLNVNSSKQLEDYLYQE